TRYINETWAEGRLDVDAELQYMQDPFERFFGFGPGTPESNESNFVSHLWFWKGRVAYEILPKFDVQLEEKWLRMNLNPRAITSLNNTATFFAGNNEVVSSNQWTNRLSLIWDTRDSRQFPKQGHYVETFGLFVPPSFDSNPFYSGYGFIGKEIFTLGERFTTVLRLTADQLFGDTVPFYMQTSLGGENDLRSFVERRFTGRGRVLFDVEERILVKSFTIMKAKFDLSLDPFFAVGQVFNQWGQVALDNLQPVGGLGFRALVPPAVVGRVDFAVGTEGINVYTTLNYPF
ncbi:MAG: BamA/TamA family outer membrane protein, partial [Deltaproteobacteria bacterium]|nr:BamA/TamA family outer membrane protein [Deltaproteobacteria bacterium]